MGRRMLRKRKVEQREEISRKPGTDFHQTEEKYAQEIETRPKKIIDFRILTYNVLFLKANIKISGLAKFLKKK